MEIGERAIWNMFSRNPVQYVKDSRLAAMIVIDRKSVGLTKGQAAMRAVLTSESVHSGSPRNSSVV